MLSHHGAHKKVPPEDGSPPADTRRISEGMAPYTLRLLRHFDGVYPEPSRRAQGMLLRLYILSFVALRDLRGEDLFSLMQISAATAFGFR